MKLLRRLLANKTGASAAEFAFVLPLALIFLFGTIDVGRYMWEINQVEKATQTGARWAVATDIIASDLILYSFATDGDTLQGEPVSEAEFPGVQCTSAGCTCVTGGACAFDATETDGDAFDALVNRMNDIKSGITADNVVVDYRYSGLGFAGDPNGPDVAPIVAVKVKNLRFIPMFLGPIINVSLPIPDLSYSLTMEDGAGEFSN